MTSRGAPGRRAGSDAGKAALRVQIDQGLSTELQERLLRLDDKRANETLTPDEHAELLRLVSELEALEAQRIESLSHLARLRGVSLAALMGDLGIRPPGHR